MKLTKFKNAALCCAFVALIYSCTNDDEVSTTTVVIIDNPIVVSNATTQVIGDWNALWLEIDRYTDAMRPNSTARALAYIHLAGYETAVPLMDGFTSNQNRLSGFSIDFNQMDDTVNIDLALNTAYALVIDHFMFSVSNNAKAQIALLQEEKARAICADLAEAVITSSVEWGTYVVEQVIAYSQTDIAGEEQVANPTPGDYIAPVGEGLWVAAEGESAWFPYWDDVRTFVITPQETTSIAPEFAYSTDITSDYYASMADVNTIATAARQEDNEDLWIAAFWSDDVEGLMMSPPGRQFSIANQLIEQEDLGFEESLELLLRLGFAINDAAVSAWDDKYTYDTQRPSNYIRTYINADFDTNLARFISFPNPAFPSYPSGHATFAGCAAWVFTSFFDRDAMSFKDTSHEGRDAFYGQSRSFTSFTQLAIENAYSRVPLGVHVQADSDEGV